MNLNDIKLTFDHSVQEVEVILAGLKKLPLEISMDLYAKIHGSTNAQIASQAAPAQPQEESNASA
jgi:hypothetical protein